MKTTCGTVGDHPAEDASLVIPLVLLRDGRIPMKSIAGRVGYSDVHALRRAVRRWESRPAEPSGIDTE